MYLHVRVTNRDYAESIGDTAALRHDFKPAVLGWRHLVALIDLVAVALFALAIRGIVVMSSCTRPPRPPEPKTRTHKNNPRNTAQCKCMTVT